MGPDTWPGGYPVYFITDDCAALSYATVKDNAPAIIEAIQAGSNNGWRIVAVEINWEDKFLTCEHSGDPIESAYGGESYESL